MPLPTVTDLHVNGLLTNVSVAFLQAESNYVAGQVFPYLPVQKKSDIYPVYSQADFMRDEVEKRAPGTESAGGGYRVDTTNSYLCEKYAWHKDVSDDEKANADAPFRPVEDATRVAVQKMLIKREVDWATDFFATGIWGADRAGASDFTRWDDVTSEPLEDIEAEKATISEATGMEPNTLTLGRHVWKALKNHPDIVDRIKHTSDGPVTTKLLAQLLEVDRVLVAKAIRNTAQEGLTGSYSFILGKHALLSYSTPNPGLYTPTAGYTFVWTGLPGSNLGQTISTLDMRWLKSERIEIESTWDHKVISSSLGVFFSAAVA